MTLDREKRHRVLEWLLWSQVDAHVHSWTSLQRAGSCQLLRCRPSPLFESKTRRKCSDEPDAPPRLHNPQGSQLKHIATKTAASALFEGEIAEPACSGQKSNAPTRLESFFIALHWRSVFVANTRAARLHLIQGSQLCRSPETLESIRHFIAGNLLPNYLTPSVSL